MIDMKDVQKNLHLHLDIVLLKEPGIYCFLLRCKRDEARPFMEWVVKTVLTREVQKLASVIEEKDNQIQALETSNEAHQQKIWRLNEENDDLRHIPHRGYFDNVLCFIKKNSNDTHPYYVIRCQYRLLKNIRDALNLVTQAWKRLAGVMIQMLFIDGTYLIVK